MWEWLGGTQKGSSPSKLMKKSVSPCSISHGLPGLVASKGREWIQVPRVGDTVKGSDGPWSSFYLDDLYILHASVLLPGIREGTDETLCYQGLPVCLSHHTLARLAFEFWRC